MRVERSVRTFQKSRLEMFGTTDSLQWAETNLK
jgi:hypothetical protein